MVPKVAGELMFRFGRPRFVVLKRLKTSQRRVAPNRVLTRNVARQAHVEALPPRPAILVALLVAEGPGGHGLEAVQRRTTGPPSSGPSWSPITVRQAEHAGAHVVAALVHRERAGPSAARRCRTASSRPGSRRRRRSSPHFLPEPKGSSTTKFTARRWRMSKSLGPYHCSRSRRVLGEGVRALGGEVLGGVVLGVAERVGDAEAEALPRSASRGRRRCPCSSSGRSAAATR